MALSALPVFLQDLNRTACVSGEVVLISPSEMCLWRGLRRHHRPHAAEAVLQLAAQIACSVINTGCRISPEEM